MSFLRTSALLAGRVTAARPQALAFAPIAGARWYGKSSASISDDEDGVVVGTIRQRNAGKFVVMLNSGHEVTATRAGRMRSRARRLQPGTRVQVLFNLEADFDEQMPKIVGLATEAELIPEGSAVQ
jgi:translation initiation factor IF-1